MCPSLCPYICMQYMHMKFPENNRMFCHCSASCINTDAALKVSCGCSKHRQLLHVPRCMLHALLPSLMQNIHKYSTTATLLCIYAAPWSCSMALSIEWVGDKGGGMGGKDGLYSSIQSCCKPGKRSNNSSTTGKGGVNGCPPLSLSL